MLMIKEPVYPQSWPPLVPDQSDHYPLVLFSSFVDSLLLLFQLTLADSSLILLHHCQFDIGVATKIALNQRITQFHQTWLFNFCNIQTKTKAKYKKGQIMFSKHVPHFCRAESVRILWYIKFDIPRLDNKDKEFQGFSRTIRENLHQPLQLPF